MEPETSRLKESVQEEKRKTFLNDLNLPTCPPKLCQNEAQDHSFQGAKDEPGSYKNVLKRAVLNFSKIGRVRGGRDPLIKLLP